ncbi:MAG: hypothetical protein JWM11_6069 [Planctomycetaceae bacterium]|nr:hypothetical protein [Planctomycetaceae bacterium]
MLTLGFTNYRGAGSVLTVYAVIFVLSLAAQGQESATSPEQPAVPAEAPVEDVEMLKKAEKPATATPATEAKAADKPKTEEISVKAPQTSETKPDSEGEEKTEKKSGAEKPKKGLQETLQEQLLGKAQAQIENPVETILERMRSVQERLGKTTTDKETRQEQAQIVQEIDKLIDALKNHKPPPPQNSSSSPDSPPPPPMGGSPDENQQARGTPQPRPRNSQKQQDNQTQQKEKERGQKQKPESAGQTESVADKAKDSNGSSSKRPRSPEEEAARQRLAKDVWGHLPPALRQELLNIFSEKYIPKYDDQVRRYYEALSEENRGE